jgi:glycosyltransferase involved in cell wall biosynthesis
MKVERYSPAERLKVLMISPAPPPLGGIGRWTILVRMAASARTDIELIHLDISPRWRAVEDLRIWKRTIGGGLQLGRDLIKFMRLLNSRPNLVHLTTSGRLATIRDLVFCLLVKFHSIPFAYHLHFGRVGEAAERNSLEWKMLRRVICRADATIVITRESEIAVRRMCPLRRIKYIPNPIEIRYLPSTPEENKATLRVLYLGWVIPTKGIAELIESWLILAMPNWKLDIIGPGKWRSQPEGSMVRFLGELPHDEAMRQMAKCDIFVLPSHTEGFPNVILEAMAYGKAIVATKVGAIPEILAEDSPEPCGVLVEPHNSEALTAALRSLMEDADLRILLGERARARVIREYEVRSIMDRLVCLWQDLKESRL